MRPRAEQPIPKLILRDLELGPATVVDLEETVGINRKNLRPYLKMLHESEAIRVVGWEQKTGPALPVYGIEGQVKKRPKVKYERRSWR
jgi:hypothetical protein